jgi:ribose-phosphate pyrophosphokinase
MNILIAYNNSAKELGIKLCEKFNLPIDLVTEQKFANGEINIKLNHSVRGKTVYLVCSGSFNNSNPDYSLNDNIMSMILTIDALKRSSAHTVNLIMPCYPYARSDKKDHRGPISSSAIAMILNTFQVDRIISCDVHSGQIQGFFPKAFDNIYCMNSLIGYMQINGLFKNCDINDKFVLCSPDAGGIKRIKAYSEKLKLNYVVMEKQRDYTKMNTVMKSVLIGDKESLLGKTVIIVDDMADTMGTMCASANELKEYGAKDCIIVVTHGYFSGEALNRINSTDFISHVICTNSISQTENMKLCEKIHEVNISSLLETVIEYIETGKSLSSLFE